MKTIIKSAIIKEKIMKKSTLFMFISLLIFAIVLSSCKNTSDDGVINGTPAEGSTNHTNNSLDIIEANNIIDDNSSDIPDSDLTTVLNPPADNISDFDVNLSDVIANSEPTEPENDLRITFLDVGHSDATFVLTPNNGSMLIDGGSDNKGSKVLLFLQKHMPDKGYLDVMIATNPAEENVGGLDAIPFNMNQIGAIYDTGEGYFGDKEYINQAYQGFYVLGGQKGTITSVSETIFVNIDEAMITKIFVPYKDGFFNATDDNSLIVKMTYGETTVVIMSRCAEECESVIKDYNIKADILRIGHFGDNVSTSQALLDAVDPKVAVISTGEFIKHNAPPSQDVLDRIAAKGITLYRTDLNGSIYLNVNKEGYSIKVQEEVDAEEEAAMLAESAALAAAALNTTETD